MSFSEKPTQIPLVYPEIMKNHNFTNIILIDSQVKDYQTFVDSVNSSTFPIVYSVMSSKTELLTLLQTHFTNISRIAIVFMFNLENTHMFLDINPLFIDSEMEPYSENTQFIINIIKEFQVENIDYLACNTLSYPNWVNYYALLTEQTGVIVGASNDKTGNIKYGGDWEMESTSEDIELVYFTKSIEYYQYLLDGFVANFIIIKSNNNYYATGANSLGNFGNGTTSNSSAFITALTPFPSGQIIKIDAFSSTNTFSWITTYIMYDNNTVYCCGFNGYGQFGNGTTTDSSSLIPAFTTLPP